MWNWYSLVDNSKLRLLLVVFLGALVIKCDGSGHPVANADDQTCPLIETLSFGSDINIKCNRTYFIFDEINNDKKFNWKLADRSPECQKNGNVQGFVNQCHIIPFDSNYLKVRLKFTTRNEYACVYCRINYQPIAPIITVTKSVSANQILYTFQLAATGLDPHESFEILWAKRANSEYTHSYNYWFSQRCMAPNVKSFRTIGRTIVFKVDDTDISRVEFIIRRCNGTCRMYQKCSEDEFYNEAVSMTIPMPDSIEKLSCDADCLDGIIPFRTLVPTTTMKNPKDTLSSTVKLSNEKQTIKLLILFILLGLLIVLAFVLLGCFILSRIKGLRSDNIYTKTSNINLDENKETMES